MMMMMMTFCFGLKYQVIELDFLYPSEGIHRRWDCGYRITSTAATDDQAAFVLSIPRRKPIYDTQETLRTSSFPNSHVKVPACLLYLILVSPSNIRCVLI